MASRPEWAARVTVHATTHDATHLHGEPEATEGDARVVTRADGSFTIPAIATGTIDFAARVDEALPVRPRLPEKLEIRSGQITHAEIPLEKGVRVSGAIRVKETGEPVSGASISVSYGAPRQSDMVVSDANGKYATLCAFRRRSDASHLDAGRIHSTW